MVFNQTDDLPLLRAESIAAPHGFTTRLGGVSRGCLGSLNIGLHRGDTVKALRENYRRLGAALGFCESDLVMTRQTHSSIVRCVTAADTGKGFSYDAYPECDALITESAGVALAVFSADCTPILFYDAKTGAVGAAHAGWRGTAANIAGKTVDAMVKNFGTDVCDLHCAIGPNIGQCCFQTDADVPQAMLQAVGDAAKAHIRTEGNKYYVNLKAINALHLQNAGVASIEISTYCTACSADLFWSHRVHGDARGAQGAVIVCRKGGIA